MYNTVLPNLGSELPESVCRLVDIFLGGQCVEKLVISLKVQSHWPNRIYSEFPGTDFQRKLCKVRIACEINLSSALSY